MKTALCLVLVSALTTATTKTFFSQEQALKSSFGDKVVTVKQTHYWTKEQRARVAKLVGSEKVEDVRGYHTGFSPLKEKNHPVCTDTAWFDQRIVRTKAQEIMLRIDAHGVILELLVCAFDEPIKYKPSAKWYDQFKGLQLDDELQLAKEIHGVSGATLTGRSTTAAVRELLAAAQVAREDTTVHRNGNEATQ
jgi:hypothetical protein